MKFISTEGEVLINYIHIYITCVCSRVKHDPSSQDVSASGCCLLIECQ